MLSQFTLTTPGLQHSIAFALQVVYQVKGCTTLRLEPLGIPLHYSPKR